MDGQVRDQAARLRHRQAARPERTGQQSPSGAPSWATASAMAPEQNPRPQITTSAPTSTRSACCMYHMPSPAATLPRQDRQEVERMNLMTPRPPPQRRRARCRTAVDEVWLKCMSKRPTAATRPAPPPWPRPLRAAVAAERRAPRAPAPSSAVAVHVDSGRRARPESADDDVLEEIAEGPRRRREQRLARTPPYSWFPLHTSTTPAGRHALCPTNPGARHGEETRKRALDQARGPGQLLSQRGAEGPVRRLSCTST
jgi:hypothetical protein